MTRCCAIISCTPEAFPWGWDEEDESCAGLKLLLLNRITLLRTEGINRFHISLDSGAGLYAAEILQGLKETDGTIETICHIPYEEQATKWTPELRDRYFHALAVCTEVKAAGPRKTVGCAFKAHLEAIKAADTVIAAYDPNDSACEREAAAVAVAEMLRKQVLVLDSKAIRFL